MLFSVKYMNEEIKVKRCKICRALKKVSEFHKHSVKNWITYYKTICRYCFNLINRNKTITWEWSERRKASKKKTYQNHKEEYARKARERHTLLSPEEKRRRSKRNIELEQGRRDKRRLEKIKLLRLNK